MVWDDGTIESEFERIPCSVLEKTIESYPHALRLEVRERHQHLYLNWCTSSSYHSKSFRTFRQKWYPSVCYRLSARAMLKQKFFENKNGETDNVGELYL